MAFFKYRSDYKHLFLATVLSGLIGIFVGPWGLLACVPLFILAYSLIQQTDRIHHWLDTGASRQEAPTLIGTANRIVDSVCEFQRINSEQQSNLTELLNRFDAATSAMPDAMIIIGPGGAIEWCNTAATPLLGIDPLRDTGLNIENIVRNPRFNEYLSKGDYKMPLEFSMKAGQGNDSVLRVFPFGRGKRLITVQDHTDMLRLQQVRHLFVSNASHEMRTPLTVIIGYLEILSSRSDLEAGVQRGVCGALEQALRLQRLVEDLLSISRLEGAPLEVEDLEVVHLGALVNESVKLIKAAPGFVEHNIALQLIEQDTILGKQSELQSAVGNVIENAIKHTPQGTPIEVELYREDNWLVLKVMDHGEGIPAHHIDRLSERFYRVDKGRSRDKGGTGLGLSIVKHVINRHRGKLLINSKVGQGTTFELRFRVE